MPKSARLITSALIDIGILNKCKSTVPIPLTPPVEIFSGTRKRLMPKARINEPSAIMNY